MVHHWFRPNALNVSPSFPLPLGTRLRRRGCSVESEATQEQYIRDSLERATVRGLPNEEPRRCYTPGL